MIPVPPMCSLLPGLLDRRVTRRQAGLVLGRDEQRGASLVRPTVWQRWSFLSEKLASLLSPCLAALGQSVFLLVSHGAALGKLCSRRIGGHIGCGCVCLRLVVTQPNRTGCNDEDNEHHCCQDRESFECLHVHQ